LNEGNRKPENRIAPEEIERNVKSNEAGECQNASKKGGMTFSCKIRKQKKHDNESYDKFDRGSTEAYRRIFKQESQVVRIEEGKTSERPPQPLPTGG